MLSIKRQRIRRTVWLIERLLWTKKGVLLCIKNQELEVIRRTNQTENDRFENGHYAKKGGCNKRNHRSTS